MNQNTDPGWIGVDLDGTLAFYDGWRGPTHIGEPILPMVERVKTLLAEGKRVKIFTARADKPESVAAIKAWLVEQGLPELEVTNVKDPCCEAIFDDRAYQVLLNDGRTFNEVALSALAQVERGCVELEALGVPPPVVIPAVNKIRAVVGLPLFPVPKENKILTPPKGILRCK